MNCGFPFLQNNPNCEFSPLELGHLSLKKFNILLVHIDVGCLLNYNSLDKPSLLPRPVSVFDSFVLLKPEKIPEFGLPVTTKSSKQRQ